MPSQSFSLPANFAVRSTDGFSRTRDWTNTLNFSSVPKFQRPINVYNDDKRQIKQSADSGAWSTRKSDGVRTYVLTPGPGYELSVIMQTYNTFLDTSGFVASVQGIEQALLFEVLKELSDSKVNVGVALAEAKKTTDHIVSTANRVVDGYLSFRRGNWKRVAENLGINPRNVHKTWLEYKYGWMPLLMDVKGTAEAFAKQHFPRAKVFSVSKKKSKEFGKTTKTTYAAYGSPPSSSAYYQTLVSKYTVRIKVRAELANPNLAHMQSLGLTNPFLIAWEVVPFSFVVDWFVSVGSYLEGISALHGLNIISAMRSNINEHRYIFRQGTTVVDGGDAYAFIYTNLARDHSIIHRAYARAPTSLSISDLYPPVNPNFSFAKLVTSMALLRGKMRF